MGRPLFFDKPASKTILIRVTPQQRRDLEQVARDNLTDLSGVIRDAVNGYVADYRDRCPVFRITKP